MSNQTSTNSTSTKDVAPKRKSWIYIFISLIVILAVGYYILMNQHAASLNHDFYRILYEASNKFNENLNSLHSMHESKESEVSIRSLLPSYARRAKQSTEAKNVVEPKAPKDAKDPEEDEETEEKKFHYVLSAQKITITHSTFTASVDLHDILPQTSQGFSQYLFADHKGSVLASTGGEKTISIVEMTSINKKLLQKNNINSLNFSGSQEGSQNPSEAPLPTFSSHIDMQLSHGDYRIFIFPFSITTPLEVPIQANDKTASLERLYLVGLLPKQQLKTKGSGHWNISILVVSLVSLLFSWAMIRLFLLPINQSITTFYRAFTQSASYLFYIVLVALILSFLTKSGLQSYKDQQALHYARSLVEKLETDLKDVFSELASYRDFYSDTKAELATLQSIKPTKPTDDKRPMWSYKETVQALNRALGQLVKDNKEHNIYALPHVVASQTWHTKLTTENTTNQWRSQIDIDKKQSRYTQQTSKMPRPSVAAEQQTQELDSDYYHQAENQLGVVSFYAGALKTNFDHANDVFNSYIPRDYIYQNVIDKQTKQALTNLTSMYFQDYYAWVLKPNFAHVHDLFTSFILRDYIDHNVLDTQTKQQLPKILTIFATDQTGFSNLPSIYFQESNAKPQAYQLSHRDYFKKVRDYRGWMLDFSSSAQRAEQTQLSNQAIDTNDLIFRNVYIQRLLNINDGTRGTTISVPMHQPSLSMPVDLSVAGLVLGADVILPSVSLAPPGPFDFIFMLVDRNTGKVLFHTDEDRSLTENLFYAGQSDAQLNQWIKAGLDKQNNSQRRQLTGFYHGEAGRFTLTPTIVDDWAMVVFSPNDSLDSFMTNQFFYIFITFVLVLTCILLLIKLIGRWRATSQLKSTIGIPAQLDTKRVLLICTAVFTTNYGLFYIGQLLQMSFPDSQLDWLFSPVLPLVGMATLLVLHFQFYRRHYARHTTSAKSAINFNQGAKLFSLGLWMVALLHFVYLQMSAAMPLKSLDFYYSQQSCNGVNKEFNELTKIALKRFPNSVTEQRIPPFALLPMQSNWQKLMLARNGTPDIDLTDLAELTNLTNCQKYLTSVTPEDYPKMSTLLGASFLWDWMKTYLINPELNKLKVKSPLTKTNPEYHIILLSIAVLLALVWLWFYYNRRVLWPKIYCSSEFLQHINNLCQSAAKLDQEQPSKRLSIRLDNNKFSGVGLTLLLRNQLNCMDDNKKNCNQILLNEFAELYNLCPCLQLFSHNQVDLPNLKISLDKDPTSNLLQVAIWDIETCLERAEYRRLLLDLILELKSLTVSKHIACFAIYAGFMSFRRVKMNDPLATVRQNQLEHKEYLSWSECLMDFRVKMPPRFLSKLDIGLLKKELCHFPELRFLVEQYTHDQQQNQNDKASLQNSMHKNVLDSDWATLHYILLHADALYRFKWESCSCAEKLALYNLAKEHRLNPSNTEMIEHLALNGMIKVHKDNLAIINKSFAHFVLHAETADTLKQLVQEGEAGVWKNYRLPVGILIVLIIGGIALTSGQSIFIIAASLAGVLGTIGSLTSSASMLRGQLRDG